jgi:hypothetical protein
MTAYDPAGTAPLIPKQSKIWRRILWLLLLLPLLPTVLILLIAMTADLKGCMAEPLAACMIGPLSLGQAFAVTAELALVMGTAFIALAPFWVALCCLAVHRSFGGLASRLIVAFAVALFLGFLPFLGPALAIGGLVHSGCRANEGGVGPCTTFGVDIGESVHELATLPWAILFVPALTLGIWLIYAIVAIVLRVRKASSNR